MAFTRVRNIEADNWDHGDGGSFNENPSYWHEDILHLINEEDPKTIVERNVIFQGEPITVLMSGPRQCENMKPMKSKHVNNLSFSMSLNLVF